MKGPPYTQADMDLIDTLIQRGVSWYHIAIILQRPSGSAVRVSYQNFKRFKASGVQKLKPKPRQKVQHATPLQGGDGLERKRAIQGRLAQIPQPQTLGQALLGHPLPGRSALDKMRDKTRATTKQPKHKAISPSVSILDISVPAREIMGNDNR